MSKVMVFDHPLIQHKVGMLRRKETNSKDFRDFVKEVGMLMGFEVTRDLPLEDVEIETPICKTVCKQLTGEDIAIVPILRAGLGFGRYVGSLSKCKGWTHRPLQRPRDTRAC